MLRYVHPIEAESIPGSQSGQPYLYPIMAPPRALGYTHHEFATIAALQAFAPFHVLTPTWLPPGCQPRIFTFRVQDGAPMHAGTAELHYTRWLTIFQWQATEPIRPPVGAGAVQEIIVGDEPALFIQGSWGETATDADRERLSQRLIGTRFESREQFVPLYLDMAKEVLPPCQWHSGSKGGGRLFIERGQRVIGISAIADITADELARVALSLA